MKQEQCPICKGTGEVDGNFYMVANFPLPPAHPITCYTCNGEGFIEVEDE